MQSPDKKDELLSCPDQNTQKKSPENPSVSTHSDSHRQNTAAARVAAGAVFAALALIFSYIEFILPFMPQMPGVKLGLANLVVVLAMYRMNNRSAFFINLIRVFMAGLLFSGVFGILYSLAGSLLSFLAMALLKRTGRFSVIGVSMAGGAAHDLGQLIMAALISGTPSLFYYFPVLWFAGMAAGIVVGIGSYILLQKLPRNLEKIH